MVSQSMNAFEYKICIFPLAFWVEGGQILVKKEKTKNKKPRNTCTSHTIPAQGGGIFGQVRVSPQPPLLHRSAAVSVLSHSLPPVFILSYSFYLSFLAPGLVDTHTLFYLLLLFTEMKHVY